MCSLTQSATRSAWWSSSERRLPPASPGAGSSADGGSIACPVKLPRSPAVHGPLRATAGRVGLRTAIGEACDRLTTSSSNREDRVIAADCTFCRVAAEDPWDQIFYSDDEAVAFLDIAPATRGHTLVVPRRHSSDIFSIDEAGFRAAARTVHRVAHLLEDRLSPDGLSIFQSNRAAGWQDVFHLHVHLVPRWDNDPLVRPWDAAVDVDLEAVVALLR